MISTDQQHKLDQLPNQLSMSTVRNLTKVKCTFNHEKLHQNRPTLQLFNPNVWFEQLNSKACDAILPLRLALGVQTTS